MSDAKTAHAARYPAQLFYSEEDGGYIAIAPDLPGCSAFGQTQEEALAELTPAIEAWIEAANSARNPIPEPTQLAVEPQPSGKLLVRFPRSLHSELIRGSKKENVSLNQYIILLLTVGSSFRAIESYASAVAQRFCATMIQRMTPTTTVKRLDSQYRSAISFTHYTSERLVLSPPKAEQLSTLENVQRIIHG